MGFGGLDFVEVFEFLLLVSGDFVVFCVWYIIFYSLNVIVVLFMKGFFVSVSSVSFFKIEIE